MRNGRRQAIRHCWGLATNASNMVIEGDGGAQTVCGFFQVGSRLDGARTAHHMIRTNRRSLLGLGLGLRRELLGMRSRLTLEGPLARGIGRQGNVFEI